MSEKTVYVPSGGITSAIFGSFDKNATLIEEAFGVRMTNRAGVSEGADSITITGDDAASVKEAAEVVELLSRTVTDGDTISEQTAQYFIGMVKDGKKSELEGFENNCVCITAKGRPIKPKTVGQRQYVDKIRENTVVLGIGPAGTGKTYLAVAMAVKALRDKQVSRIILTRPAIEAGEKLGFLPGAYAAAWLLLKAYWAKSAMLSKSATASS